MYAYKIFPIRRLNNDIEDEFNNVIDFVAKHWKFFFENEDGIKNNKKFDISDLYGSDLIGVFYYKSKIVGIHTAAFYNLECPMALSTSYLQRYSREVIQQITNDGLSKVFSIENLIGDYYFLKNNQDFQLMPLAMYISCRLSDSYGLDGYIATVREGKGIAQKVIDYGGNVYGQTNIYSVPCLIFGFENLKTNLENDSASRLIAKRLWENHENYHLKQLSEITYKYELLKVS